MQKVKKIAFWVMTAAYLIAISSFVNDGNEGVLCNSIDVVIADSAAKRFLKPNDITDMLSVRNQLALGEPISSIDVDAIEKTVISNTMVRDCRAYSTIDGKITIELWQREPVVRIIDKNGKSYYLDTEGSVITMSKRFTPHILVVNGYISTPFNTRKVENIYKEDFDQKAKELREIHKMAMYLRDNEFWNSQIVQMYLNAEGDFEIIPRVGPHLIILGRAEGFEAKLRKLKIFYEEGIKPVGWNKYLKINIKYKDQIVCTKI